MNDDTSEGILNPGDVLNNTYVITELVASGGTGEVYRATNRVSGREIAIKILKAEFAQDEQFINLMKREASVLHEVIDPSVVRYYDLLESDMHGGFLFIVMEFIHGQSLADEMRRSGPIAASVLLKVAKRILLGLKAAHGKNAFHRDLSPDNIILRDGIPDQATLIDFGIAKDVNEGAKTVIGDGFAGKYQYAAPEQMEGQADGRSDLYSLGMTLIGAFRGQSPSAGSSLMQIIRSKADKPDISDMTGQLHSLVSRLVEPNPDDRFSSAQEALNFMRSGMEQAAKPYFDDGKTVMIRPSASRKRAKTRPEMITPQPLPPKSVPPTQLPPRTQPPGTIPPNTIPPKSVRLQSLPPHAVPTQTVPPQTVLPAVPVVQTNANAGSESTIEKLQEAYGEPKKSKTGLWISLVVLLLIAGGAGGWFAGLFDPARAPEPPIKIAIGENPTQPSTTVPQTPDIQLTTPGGSPGTPGSPTLQPSPSQQTDLPATASPPSQQDPTAPPGSSPEAMPLPKFPVVTDQGLTPGSTPGTQTLPGPATLPGQTPGVSPTAGDTVLPVASPYVLTIQRNGMDNPLLLRGNLPSAEALLPITTILEDQLNSYAVQAEIKPASGMPSEGWAGRIVVIALSFAQLDSWTVSASDNRVTLSGKARNKAERTALLDAAQRAIQGTNMVIIDNITVGIEAVELATISTALQSLRSCGPLHLTGGKNGVVAPGVQLNVSGNLANATEISAIQAFLSQAAPGRRIINTLNVINPGVCSVLQILPDVKSNKLRLDYSFGSSLNVVKNDTFHLGDNPVIDVAVDARAEGYMSVIFVDQADQVYHLLPHQSRQQNKLQSIGVVKNGVRKIRAAFPISEASVEQLGFKVVEPLGANMIIAVVTPFPLFNDLRPRAESNAAFIAAIKNKLIFARESDGIVTFRSLITAP